jgi:Fe2+ or Zn2+ uptake regulation protein
MIATITPGIDQFIARWKSSGASEQAQVVQRALQHQDRPVTAEDLYQHFKTVSKATKAQRIQQIDSLLQTFNTLGLLRKTDQGHYVK